MKPELTKDNLKIALAKIFWEENYTDKLIRYLETDTDCWTNEREDLYSAFFDYNLSVDYIGRELDYIKVWTRHRINGNSDWVSDVLSIDIDHEFNFVYIEFKKDWDNFVYSIRPEEELLDNIIEILQWWNKKCEFFYNEFVK